MMEMRFKVTIDTEHPNMEAVKDLIHAAILAALDPVYESSIDVEIDDEL